MVIGGVTDARRRALQGMFSRLHARLLTNGTSTLKIGAPFNKTPTTIGLGVTHITSWAKSVLCDL